MLIIVCKKWCFILYLHYTNSFGTTSLEVFADRDCRQSIVIIECNGGDSTTISSLLEAKDHSPFNDHKIPRKDLDEFITYTNGDRPVAIIVRTNGDIYEGECRDGKLHGNVSMRIAQTGEILQRTFENGQIVNSDTLGPDPHTTTLRDPATLTVAREKDAD